MSEQEINLNTQFDFLKSMFDAVNLKFHEQFPEYFIRCKTLDKEVYDSVNKSGYSYYLAIINSIKVGCFENSFKIDDYYETIGINVIEERQRLYDSLNECKDIRIWCFNNIQLL